MMSPLAFVVSAVAGRNTWSLLFEVLPVWLLAMQSLVAISSKGDVDGRSDTPLFSRPVHAIRSRVSSLRGRDSKLADFLGKWSIQERHNSCNTLKARSNGWPCRPHCRPRCS